MKKFITKTVCIAFMAMLCAWNLNAQECEVSTLPNPPLGGVTVGDGIYLQGDIVTVWAIASPFWQLINWTEDSTEVSTEAVYTFTVRGDHHLVANFVPGTCEITLLASPVEGGILTVNGIPSFGGDYLYGESITMKAIHAPDYVFINWTEDGTEVSTEVLYTFTVERSRHLVANFVPGTCAITLLASPAEGGEVVGSDVYSYGEEITIKAEPHSDYNFVNWTDYEYGYVISTAPEYVFTVNGPRSLVANFVPSTCEITLSKNIEEGGTLVGEGVYPYGQIVIVHAILNLPEYQFVNWTEDGNVVSISPVMSFPVTKSRHLVANFEHATYEIPVYANPSEGGSVTGGGIYPYGASVTISAEVNPDYEFLNWTKYVLGNGTVVSTEPSYTFEVTGEGNMGFVAYFTTSGKTVTVLANIPGGEILGGGVYHYGDEVTVEAIPHPGYVFTSWAEGRGTVSTDNPYRFTVTEDLVLIANFEETSVGIGETGTDGINVYPNPTTGELIIENGKLNIENVEIFDVMGRMVHTVETRFIASSRLDISDLSAGIYFVRITTETGTITKKIEKQ